MKFKLVKIAIILICIHMMLFNNVSADKKKNSQTFRIIPAKNSSIKVIIFDLGDVLITASRRGYIISICAMTLRYPSIMYRLLKQNIKQDLFALLQTIPAISTQPMYNTGQQIPPIMVDWLTGRSNNEILAKTLDCIAKQNCSTAQKALFATIVQKIFDPESFVKSLCLIQPMASLAKSLKSSGYTLYVLSNWDTESFPLLQEKYRTFFELFDGIMISGTTGVGKPSPRFYQALLQTYSLNPNECVFIDDEKHNIKAANTLGIRGVLNDSENSVCLQLQKLGVLQLTNQ